MIVLHYIKNNSQRYQTFVANRVSQIRELSLPEDWRHVDSALNPADDTSRGVEADQLTSRKLWIQGSGFLWQKEAQWPQIPDAFEVHSESLELKTVKVHLVEVESMESCTSRLMKRYSSMYRLTKAVAWILRLKCCLLERLKGYNSKACISKEPLTVHELRQAEIEIIKHVQGCEFTSEIGRIVQGSAVENTSTIRNLDAIVNFEGILCVGVRLSNAPLSELSKHQISLPKSHHVVTLIVRSIHEHLGHSGKKHVLSELRRMYWIVVARRAVKQVLNQCIKCKRSRRKQFTQKMADLPEDRATPGKPPFSHVWVDCFGPFYVKRGRCEVKRYGCLFTCLCTRAIHIEKLDSMDTNSFIQALRHFAEVDLKYYDQTMDQTSRELKESSKKQ